MVHEGIARYLKEGVKRGFSLNLLKQKLLEGGFQERDVDETVLFLGLKPVGEKIKMEVKPAAQIAEKISTGEITNSTSSNEIKWMRIGGIFGFILFSLLLLLYISSYFFSIGLGSLTGEGLQEIPFAASSLILFLIFFVVFLVLIFFYYFGFTKMGKYLKSKLLFFSSWAIILLVIILIIVSVIRVVYLYQVFGDSNAGDANINIIQNISVLLKIMFVGSFIGAVATLLFGIASFKAKIKYSKIAGTLHIIFGIYGIVILLGVILGASFFENIYIMITTPLLILCSIFFGSLSLLSASTQFEEDSQRFGR
ncbi:hypothetical protein J4462_04580 [Candidatus Pacearchaeota archaeon]|nr:hypothetical protein [Candidatus Pacearchaeota archaeon]